MIIITSSLVGILLYKGSFLVIISSSIKNIKNGKEIKSKGLNLKAWYKSKRKIAWNILVIPHPGQYSPVIFFIGQSI